jgi:hypothetical protein
MTYTVLVFWMFSLWMFYVSHVSVMAKVVCRSFWCLLNKEKSFSLKEKVCVKKMIMFGRHIVVAFAVCLAIHLSVCLSIHLHSAFPASTGQSAEQISMKLHRSDHAVPSLVAHILFILCLLLIKHCMNCEYWSIFIIKRLVKLFLDCKRLTLRQSSKLL